MWKFVKATLFMADDSPPRTVQFTPDEWKTFGGWMDRNDPLFIGPLTIEGVTYQQGDVEGWAEPLDYIY